MKRLAFLLCLISAVAASTGTSSLKGSVLIGAERRHQPRTKERRFGRKTQQTEDQAPPHAEGDLMHIWKTVLPLLTNTFADPYGALPEWWNRDDIVFSSEGEETVAAEDNTSAMMQSSFPSDVPSLSPSDFPSMLPSDVPSLAPSGFPSILPSDFPSSDGGSRGIVYEESLSSPLDSFSDVSDIPSLSPTGMPSMIPSDMPSMIPSNMPSDMPSLAPISWTDSDSDGTALDPDKTFFCPNMGRDADAPTRDILYAYRLELIEGDTELADVIVAIENRLQVELTSGTETVCNATDMYLEDVIAVTADPLDIPAAVCGVFTETTGDGACSFISGRMRIALAPDGVGDPMVEAGVYCRTLDLIRAFLDSGIIEEEMPEVAMVRSTILDQLVPSFCSVLMPNETIAMDESIFEGEGEEDGADEEDGSDEADAAERGIDVVGVVSLENETKSRKRYVVPLTVVLSVSLALLVAFLIYRKRRNTTTSQHQQDEISQELMDERADMEDSFESGKSDMEAWPKTPDSGMVFGSMSEMAGSSQLASPISATNGNEYHFDMDSPASPSDGVGHDFDKT